LEPLFESFAEEATSLKPFTAKDFDSCLEEAPDLSPLKVKKIKFRPVKMNYLEKEQKNRVLGAEGGYYGQSLPLFQRKVYHTWDLS
jgi:hypothetical protein